MRGERADSARCDHWPDRAAPEVTERSRDSGRGGRYALSVALRPRDPPCELRRRDVRWPPSCQDPRPADDLLLVMATEDDLERIREAAIAYFRLAAELSRMSLLALHAARLADGDDFADDGEESDREFLADRAGLYAEKAELAAESGLALLRDAQRSFADLEEVEADFDDLLRAYADQASQAADQHVEVVRALGGASFADLADYPDLLTQQRGSVQFLSAEAALFRAIADDDLDPAPDEDDEDAAPSVATETPRPRFDRRVPQALLAAIEFGGSLGWVSAMARRPITAEGAPLDLGLRALPGKPDAGRATLYLGTTKVLDIHLRPDGKFSLTGHAEGKLFGTIDPPFDPKWSKWQDANLLADQTVEIRRHVAAAVEGAPAGRQVEGRYQAALTKLNAGPFVVVDREVSLSLTGGSKREWIRRLRQPLVDVQTQLAKQYGWAKGAVSPGDKLDALAIDDDGRVLAIEVKPGASTKGLTWTPVQVAMYVRLLRSWVSHDEQGAAEILEGMAGQRLALGLNGCVAPRVRLPIEIVPVIAVGKPMTSRRQAPDRFDIVREALRAAGEPLHDLQIWCVELSGELTCTDAESLRDERLR